MKGAVVVLALLATMPSQSASRCRPGVVFSGGRGGGCTTTVVSIHQRSRELPPDIANMPASSLVRRKYEKMFFDIIPKTIRNWQDKDYKERSRYLVSPQWTQVRDAFAAKLKTMHNKLDRDPAVTEEEVLKLADEMVVYGRGLVKGNFPQMPTFREIAEAYGFTEVEKFLKKALDVDRFRHTGMAQKYLETDEFKDFDKLAGVLSPDDWAEYRNRWRQLNALYENNPKRKAVKPARKR